MLPSLLGAFLACKGPSPPDAESDEPRDTDPCENHAWYADADGDGVGGQDSELACEAPSGHVSENGDCDDQDSTVHPGADEDCSDGVDNDCRPAA